MVKHGGQKYRSDDQIIIAQVKTQTSLTTVAARFAMIRVSRGSRTEFLASVLFLAVAAGATIVKAMRGAEMPAVGNACSGQLEPSGSAWHRSDLQPSTSASLDWSGALPNQPPGIYGGSSCRDAALPAGWCADRFGGATTAVAGCTRNLSHSASCHALHG
jgi:hypothetical protein